MVVNAGVSREDFTCTLVPCINTYTNPNETFFGTSQELMLTNRMLLFGVLAAAAACLGGCTDMTGYAGNELPLLAKSGMPVVRQPRPVVVQFQFRTKGIANSQATTQLRPRVISAVVRSGIFGQVSYSSSSSIAAASDVLKVTINDEVNLLQAYEATTAAAYSFYVRGSDMTHVFACTASFTRSGRSTEATVKESLHTIIGMVHVPPPGLVKMRIMDATNEVTDQVVWHALKQLYDQKAFGP